MFSGVGLSKGPEPIFVVKLWNSENPAAHFLPTKPLSINSAKILQCFIIPNKLRFERDDCLAWYSTSETSAYVGGYESVT